MTDTQKIDMLRRYLVAGFKSIGKDVEPRIDPDYNGRPGIGVDEFTIGLAPVNIRKLTITEKTEHVEDGYCLDEAIFIPGSFDVPDDWDVDTIYTTTCAKNIVTHLIREWAESRVGEALTWEGVG